MFYKILRSFNNSVKECNVHQKEKKKNIKAIFFRIVCVWRRLSSALTLPRVSATMTDFLRPHIAIVEPRVDSAIRIPLSFTGENEQTARIERECETVENIRGPCRLINASDSNVRTHWRPGTMPSAFRSCGRESRLWIVGPLSCPLTLFGMTDCHSMKHS